MKAIRIAQIVAGALMGVWFLLAPTSHTTGMIGLAMMLMMLVVVLKSNGQPRQARAARAIQQRLHSWLRMTFLCLILLALAFAQSHEAEAVQRLLDGIHQEIVLRLLVTVGWAFAIAWILLDRGDQQPSDAALSK